MKGVASLVVAGCLAIAVSPAKAQDVYYKTKADAIAHVPSHVQPKDCFVWNDGPKATPWRVIPGTGCAHWVAHQLGIRRGVTCFAGYSIRVADVTGGRKAYAISQAQIGDIWAIPTHCGIVRRLDRDKNGKIVSVGVQNDSSGAGGVVMTTYTDGSVYR